MSEDLDPVEVRLNSLCANLGEHFEDFLVVVRPRRRTISWRSSDATWAIGAADRYISGVRMSDNLVQEEHFRHNGGG